jgi:serine/threonine-protein kinase
MDSAITELGPYRLLARIGESELAEVFRGEDTLFDRSVAVKVLRTQAADDLALVRRFVASGREAMRLRHANIARVYDAGQADGRYYVATELVEGKSLHDELARGKGAWSAERTLALVGQVAAALDYAHGLGLVHLNLKPSNILLADDGRVLVTDFDGEASPAWAGDPDGPLFSRLKSPAFLAPEQARGDEAIGPAADIYSLAALTYTLCAGRAPFAGRNPLGLLRQIAETPPPRVDRVAPAVAATMADALAAALAKEPRARPHTAAALTRSLVEGVPPGRQTEPTDASISAASRQAIPTASPVTVDERPPMPGPFYEPRTRFSPSAMPTSALALLALASLAALLMLIAAMRTAGTLMARLNDEPRDRPGTVEIVALPTVTPRPEAGNPLGPEGSRPEARTPQATATAAGNPLGAEVRPPTLTPAKTPTVVPTPSPVPTSAVAAPRPQQGLMAAASSQVRMVTVMTPRPTATPQPSRTVTPTSTETPTPLPTNTASPTPTPAASLDDFSLVGRIAYTQWNLHTDRPDIYIWDTKLRANGVPLPNYRQPDFGPHGLLIANAEGAGQDNLVQMGWLGENAVIVSAHPEDAHPHWSPNGKQVVFDSAHMGDRQYRIYLQDDLTRRDDRPPMTYLAWELFGRYPVFLANGQIAYNGCNYWASGSVCGVYVVDTAGGMPVAATGWPGDVPTDNLGNRVLLMSDRSGNWDVYSVNADGTELRQLTGAPGNDGLATASPDGRAVAFLTDREGHWSVYVMRPDGSDATKLFDLSLGFGRGEYDWFQERLSWGY